MTSNQAKETDERAEFCARLRRHREASNQSLADIAATTRIPMRSLEQLERGDFDALPADVFVRGFLRSYARCVGLDADDTLRKYGKLGFDAAPVSSDLAQELLEQLKETEEPKPRRKLARGTEPARSDLAGSKKKSATEWLSRMTDKRGDDDRDEHAEEDVEARSSKKSQPKKRSLEAAASERRPTSQRPRIFLPRDFSVEEDENGRRGNLTFAVIVLVIVATIAMSYLMRRPSHSGDGISQVDALAEAETLA